MTAILSFLVGYVVMATVIIIISKRREKAAAEKQATLTAELTACKADLTAKQQELAEQQHNLAAKQQELTTKQQEITEQRQQITALTADAAAKQREIELLTSQRKEQAEQRKELRQQLEESMKLVKAELQNKSEDLLRQRETELNKANKTQLDTMLEPFKVLLNEMKTSIDSNKESFCTQSSRLEKQIEMMGKRTETLGEEAEKLSKALHTTPNIQGNFGEMKLNNLLEAFGFTQGVEYDTQYVMRDARGNVIRNIDTDNRMRPDVVLHYPDKKDVVVDAKTSLTAFIDYTNAQTGEERDAHLKAHAHSVRRHVDELAQKSYNRYSMDGRSTLDFVVMFVPHEAAMQLALAADPMLWQEAFNKKVMIVGEQNLYALLRLLEVAWTQQKQGELRERVYELANILVDRVGLFAERFEKVGKEMDDVRKAFDEVNKSLHGNMSLVVPARKLVALGAKENKNRPLPEITDDNDNQALL